MKTRLVILGQLVAILVSWPLRASADLPLSSVEDLMITEVEVTTIGAIGARVQISFDEPQDVADVERELEKGYGDLDLAVESSGVATAVASPASSAFTAKPRISWSRGRPSSNASKNARGDFGNTIIHCNSSYRFADGNAIYNIQRQCGVRTAPWGLRLTPYWVANCVGEVAEGGLRYSTNGNPVQQNGPHSEWCGYQFHGTFWNVGAGDASNYYDQLYFRHSIGPGGYVNIEVYGTHRWRSNA